MYEKVQMPGLAEIISFIYIQLSGANPAFFTVHIVIPWLHSERASAVADGLSSSKLLSCYGGGKS